MPPQIQVLHMLGDIAAGPAYRFSQWLELVRKRSGKHRASAFHNRPHPPFDMPFGFAPPPFFLFIYQLSTILPLSSEHDFYYILTFECSTSICCVLFSFSFKSLVFTIQR